MTGAVVAKRFEWLIPLMVAGALTLILLGGLPTPASALAADFPLPGRFPRCEELCVKVPGGLPEVST
jgi:hypothetical protein